MAEYLFKFQGKASGGKITCEASDADIRNLVIGEGKIVIIKGIFPGDPLLAARDAVHAWAQKTAAHPHGQPIPDTNYHSVEIGISKFQKTLHAYHSFNFNQLHSLEDKAMREQLLEIWSPMREFQNRITERSSGWEWDGDKRKLHPQVIQYPCGGGHFAAHTHPFDPQKMGLILAISKRGTDFDTGGTGFEMPDKTGVDTSPHHDLGDMILFRYDVRHWISTVNLEEKMDLASKRGRWTMVLPYY